MHCDVDLRSRRMWAASYRLTRLVMYESSELLESFCTGHARVRAERGGDGGDGAVADAPVLGHRCCCSCTSSLGALPLDLLRTLVMASRYSPVTLVLTGNERAAMTRLSPLYGV